MDKNEKAAEIHDKSQEIIGLFLNEQGGVSGDQAPLVMAALANANAIAVEMFSAGDHSKMVDMCEMLRKQTLDLSARMAEARTKAGQSYGEYARA